MNMTTERLTVEYIKQWILANLRQNPLYNSFGTDVQSSSLIFYVFEFDVLSFKFFEK